MSDSGRLNEREIASVAATVKAPESLHRRVQVMTEQAAAQREGRRTRGAADGLRVGGRLRFGGLRVAVTATAAATVAAAVLAVSLLGGGSSGLTVQTAAALALKPATLPAPAESATDHSRLQASVEGVAFPYWNGRFGWRSAGERVDHIAGRSVRTVFYMDTHGRWLGYAIASGRAPRLGGVAHWRAGIPYRVFAQGGATVVAWPRDGHLCVLVARGVQAKTLLRLAGWSRTGAGAGVGD